MATGPEHYKRAEELLAVRVHAFARDVAEHLEVGR